MGKEVQEFHTGQGVTRLKGVDWDWMIGRMRAAVKENPSQTEEQWQDNTEKETALLIDAGLVSTQSLILDVGCGQGRHISEFLKRGFKNIYGLDLSKDQLDTNKQANPQANLFLGDMGTLPFQSKFDLAYMITSGYSGMNTTPESDLFVRNELYQIHQVLRPHGRFITEIDDIPKMIQEYISENANLIDGKIYQTVDKNIMEGATHIVTHSFNTDTLTEIRSEYWVEDGENKLWEWERKFMTLDEQIARFEDCGFKFEGVYKGSPDSKLSVFHTRSLIAASAD